MFSRAWVGRTVLLGLILLGCSLLSSAQDPTGSKKLRFGGGYDSLEPAQQELVQKWHGEYEAITGRSIDARLGYDNLPLATRTTFDAVTARHFSQLLVALPDDTAEQAAGRDDHPAIVRIGHS
jgi:hypothetical protein